MFVVVYIEIIFLMSWMSEREDELLDKIRFVRLRILTFES